MSEDRNDDQTNLSRRDALLAAGVGGMSLMGLCSACEAGEASNSVFGASTPTKNISRLSKSNPIIQQINDAAPKWKGANIAAPKVSDENVISRIQEITHDAKTQKRLRRARTVVRTSAAALDFNDRPRVLRQMGELGFDKRTLANAQVFFTRTSLLDDRAVGNVASLPVSKLVQELEPNPNTNFNTVAAISFDKDRNAMHLSVVLNGNRGAFQVTYENMLVSPAMIQSIPEKYVEPPHVTASVSLYRNLKKKFTLIKPITVNPPPPTEPTPTEPGPTERSKCYSDCVTSIGAGELAFIVAFCSACGAAIGAALAAELATAGAATPAAFALIGIACAPCLLLGGVTFFTCFDICTRTTED